MSVIVEIAKDTLGISGYQHQSERDKIYHSPKSTEIFTGVLSGTEQVLIPLSHQQLDRLFAGSGEEEAKVRYGILALLTDVAGIAGVIWLVNQNPQEAIQTMVGAKLIYNAAASAIPRAIKSVRRK